MGVLTYFFDPVVHIFKAMLICNIVDKNNPCSALVIRVGQGSEFDLSSSVPDGHANLWALMHDVFLFMVDSCSADQLTFENAVWVAVQQAWFANPGVAQKSDFYCVVRLGGYRLLR